MMKLETPSAREIICAIAAKLHDEVRITSDPHGVTIEVVSYVDGRKRSATLRVDDLVAARNPAPDAMIEHEARMLEEWIAKDAG